jgi:hypothetical protein
MIYYKIKIFSIILFLISFHNLSSSQSPIWTIGTPKTVKKKEIHLSLFYFSKYGITNTFEVESKPAIFPLLPHLNFKKTWYCKKSTQNKNWLKSRNLIIGSIHGINYPSMTLKLARNREYRDLIPITTEIPHIFAFRNEILISTILKNKTSCDPANFLLTIKAGVKFSLTAGDNSLPYFVNPFLFRETSIYHNKLLWYLGLGLDGNLYSNLNFSLDLNYYSIGLKTDYRSIEHNGIIYWYAGKQSRFRLALGYKVSTSNFPYKKLGFFPLLDITFMFRTDKKNARDLFEQDIYDSFDDRDKNEDL